MSKRTFPTIYTFAISLPHGGSYLGGSNDGTLPSVLSAAFETATYYAALYPTVTVTIAVHCAECRGNGKVPKARPRLAYKACPVCKGEGEPRDVLSFAAKAHECTKVEIIPAS